MTGLLVFVTVVLTLTLLAVWRQQIALRRERFIRSFSLPHGLFDNLMKRHPGLSLKQCQLVAHGLRQFFLAYLKSRRQFVSMPSQIADDLWHEFILFTRNYDVFCRHAFGGFLHHTPAVVLGSQRQSNAGLRRCWWHVCVEENINPKAPTRLPLLFALDAKLDVPNGFHYAADCNPLRRTKDGRPVVTEGSVVYCGGDFSSDSFDGGTDGLGDAGGSSDGGASGDGGGGCGGGGD